MENIVVYCFSCTYNANDYEIKSVKEENKNLNIEIGHTVPYRINGETVPPVYRIVAIQIPKLGYTNITVSEKINLYDRAVDWVTEDFIDTNKTRNACYKEEVFGRDEPKDITRIIRSNEEFDEIFAYYPDDVDFETEIIVVYCFTCIYNGNDYEIKNIDEENGELKIELEHIPPYNPSGEAIGYTSAPIYRIIALQIPDRGYANIIVSEYSVL